MNDTKRRRSDRYDRSTMSSATDPDTATESDVDTGDGRPSWTFLTNHAHVLVAIGQDPEMRQRDIADAVVRVRYKTGEEQAGTVDETAIRQALAEADTVAAIEREAEPVERRRRTSVQQDTTLKDAVERYVDQHETLAKIKDRLVEAALEIEQEVDSEAS